MTYSHPPTITPCGAISALPTDVIAGLLRGPSRGTGTRRGGLLQKDSSRDHLFRDARRRRRFLVFETPSFDGRALGDAPDQKEQNREGVHPDAPTDKGKHRYAELLTATGFLRMAPDGTRCNTVFLPPITSV